MIIEIENKNGDTIMAFELNNDEIGKTLNCSFADEDTDDIFNTKQMKIRMQEE